MEKIHNSKTEYFSNQFEGVCPGIDKWEDFNKNNWVYTWGPGGTQPWSNETNGKYPLTEPNAGDIILVRTGIETGRAIGIVDKNDYKDKGLNENSKIHVLWINKSANNFPKGRRKNNIL